MGTGLNNAGRALGEFGGRLYVSGMFTAAGDRSANHITSWSAGTVSAAPETRITLGPRAAPNPFGGSTSISFALAEDRNTAVDVYDIRGRRVARLYRGRMRAGPNAVAWNGRDDSGRRQPAGTYFIRARSAAEQTTTKVNLIR